MPFFSTSRSTDPNNTRAAAMASRYGRVSSAYSARKPIKDNQTHNTIRDKSEQPENITKAQFYPTGRRTASASSSSHLYGGDFHLKQSSAFVHYYPKAKSFEQQIEQEEKSANTKALSEAAVFENIKSQQRRQPPPQPTPKHDEGQQQQQQQNDDDTTNNKNTANDGCDNTDAILRNPTATAPFATNPYNQALYQHTASSPARLQQQHGLCSSPANNNSNQRNSTMMLSEYQQQFSSPRDRSSSSQQQKRVPVNRDVEIVLQRNGYDYIHQPEKKTAFEKYQERNPGGFPVTWQKPKKSQPEVVLTMLPPASSSSASQSKNKSNQRKSVQSSSTTTTRPRPSSVRTTTTTRTSEASIRNEEQNENQQQQQRPSSARNAREQRYPPRTGLTQYEKNKMAEDEQRKATLAARKIRTNSITQRFSRNENQVQEEEVPPHYQSPARGPGGANRTDKYHEDCTKPRYQRQKELLQEQLRSGPRRRASSSAGDELPSTSHFVDPYNNQYQQNQQQNDNNGGCGSSSCNNNCHCACHAVQNHDDIIAKTMYSRAQNKRMLHTVVPNFQQVSKTGVGACLKWEVIPKNNTSNNLVNNNNVAQNQGVGNNNNNVSGCLTSSDNNNNNDFDSSTRKRILKQHQMTYMDQVLAMKKKQQQQQQQALEEKKD